MAALMYHLLSLSLYITLLTACSATPKNFSGSAAASGYNIDDYNSDDDRRTDIRASLQYPSIICRAKNTSFQISPVSCPGQSAERFEYGKRYMKVTNTDNAIHIRFLMAGLGKKDVKVYIDEKDQLIVEGKKGMDFDEGYFIPRFVLHLPMVFLKANEITAEMKNGVLKLRIPKTKQQQRRSGIVVFVKVE